MDAFSSSRAEMNLGNSQSEANIARIVWKMQSTNWAWNEREKHKKFKMRRNGKSMSKQKRRKHRKHCGAAYKRSLHNIGCGLLWWTCIEGSGDYRGYLIAMVDEFTRSDVGLRNFWTSPLDFEKLNFFLRKIRCLQRLVLLGTRFFCHYRHDTLQMVSGWTDF